MTGARIVNEQVRRRPVAVYELLGCVLEPDHARREVAGDRANEGGFGRVGRDRRPVVGKAVVEQFTDLGQRRRQHAEFLRHLAQQRMNTPERERRSAIGLGEVAVGTRAPDVRGCAGTRGLRGGSHRRRRPSGQLPERRTALSRPRTRIAVRARAGSPPQAAQRGPRRSRSARGPRRLSTSADSGRDAAETVPRAAPIPSRQPVEPTHHPGRVPHVNRAPGSARACTYFNALVLAGGRCRARSAALRHLLDRIARLPIPMAWLSTCRSRRTGRKGGSAAPTTICGSSGSTSRASVRISSSSRSCTCPARSAVRSRCGSLTPRAASRPPARTPTACGSVFCTTHRSVHAHGAVRT